MNRRDTLKKLAITTGGLITLPSWAREWNSSDLSCHPSSFSIEAQEILAAVADTIIPVGDAIGALTVGVDKFLQKLIDDCYEKPVQNNIRIQLAGLDTVAQQVHQKPFSVCDLLQRQALLEKLGVSELTEERDFFNLLKSETIRGFNTSREVMVHYHHYQLVPGHYYGCIDLKS